MFEDFLLAAGSWGLFSQPLLQLPAISEPLFQLPGTKLRKKKRYG